MCISTLACIGHCLSELFNVVICADESEVSLAAFGHPAGPAGWENFPSRSWADMAKFALWSAQPLVGIFTGEDSAQKFLALGVKAILFVFTGQYAGPVLKLAEAVAKSARPNVVGGGECP